MARQLVVCMLVIYLMVFHECLVDCKKFRRPSKKHSSRSSDSSDSSTSRRINGEEKNANIHNLMNQSIILLSKAIFLPEVLSFCEEQGSDMIAALITTPAPTLAETTASITTPAPTSAPITTPAPTSAPTSAPITTPTPTSAATTDSIEAQFTADLIENYTMCKELLKEFTDTTTVPTTTTTKEPEADPVTEVGDQNITETPSFVVSIPRYCRLNSTAYWRRADGYGLYIRPAETEMETPQATDWIFESVYKEVNPYILNESRNAMDQFHCSVICSSLQLESLFYVPSTGMCHCNRGRDNCIESSTAELIQYGLKKTDGVDVDHITVIPGQDCLDFYDQGCLVDGIYPIVGWDGHSTPVRCDMTGGGWTIIQQRFDGSVNFRRNWTEYRLGFGEICGEYWIGLENIHHLVYPDSELIINVEMFPGVTPTSMTAHYGYFYIGDNSTKFQLSNGNFNGTCGDSFVTASNFRFSTIDEDNDIWNGVHCADVFNGGWWYTNCHKYVVKSSQCIFI